MLMPSHGTIGALEPERARSAAIGSSRSGEERVAMRASDQLERNTMAMTTTPSLDNEVKARIGVPSATRGRSTQGEARRILAQVVRWELSPEDGFGTAVHKLLKTLGGVGIELPPREPSL